MSVAKVLEVICEGKSVEAALESAVHIAAQTVKNIVQIDVEHIKAIVEKNKIAKYRVRAKISFVLEK
jgi:flavin-binding protein dodecin